MTNLVTKHFNAYNVPKMIRSSLITLALTYLSGCQTGQVNISSTPEASDVFVVAKNGSKQKLGQTPLNFSLSRLGLTSGGMAELRLEKQGHDPVTYLVPHTAISSNHQITANLIKKGNGSGGFGAVETCEDISKDTINSIGKSIASVQSLILKRDLDIASAKVANVIAEYPYVSVLYDLQGNIYYLQKSYIKALGSYQRSIALDPKNIETTIMVKRLKELTGLNN
jgi:tetratricopeptide (TPR) repeat protein